MCHGQGTLCSQCNTLDLGKDRIFITAMHAARTYSLDSITLLHIGPTTAGYRYIKYYYYLYKRSVHHHHHHHHHLMQKISASLFLPILFIFLYLVISFS